MSVEMLATRAVGCLAGSAVGDALGGATEGWESHEIHNHYGGWVEGTVQSMRHRLGVVKPFSPFWKGEGHVTDDTLDDARPRAGLRRQARPPRRVRPRGARRAADRRRADLDSRARPRGSALSPALPRREVARAQAPLRPREPAGRRDREHRQLRGRDVHRSGRHRQRVRSRRRLSRGTRPHGRPPVELRPRGRRRAGSRGRRGDAAGRDARVGRGGRHPACQGRDADRDRGGRRGCCRARRLARRGPGDAPGRDRAVRLGRRALRDPAQDARTPSRLRAIEEVPVALGLLLATDGDYLETMLGGVNYGRDSDSIASMGGSLAGALGSTVPPELSRRSGRRAGSTSRSRAAPWPTWPARSWPRPGALRGPRPRAMAELAEVAV